MFSNILVAAENGYGCNAVELAEGNKTYNKLVCDSLKAMNDKDYKYAISLLDSAIKEPILEFPNFMLFSRLSYAYYLNGDKKTAAELIEKAELSLSVLSGIYKCNENKRAFFLTKNGEKIIHKYHDEIALLMCPAEYDYIYMHKNLESYLFDLKLIEFYFEVRKKMKQ